MITYLSFAIDEYFLSPFSASGGKSLADIVTLILSGGLAIAGVALLIILIGAGITIISSAGKGKPDDLTKATKVATTALVGFIIVFAAYLIVQLIGNIFIPGSPDMIINPGV
jgi:hypothetical protein